MAKPRRVKRGNKRFSASSNDNGILAVLVNHDKRNASSSFVVPLHVGYVYSDLSQTIQERIAKIILSHSP